MSIELDAAAQFQAAREEVARAARELKKGIEAMLELAGPERTHDQMAELIDAVNLVGTLLSGPAKEPGQPKEPGIKKRMEEAALDWLLANPSGVKRIRVGNLDYFGTLEKVTKCRDVGHTGATLAHLRLENSLLEVVVNHGSEEATDFFWRDVEDFCRAFLASDGIKEGAGRQLIEADAEQTLRSLVALDARAIEPLDCETPEQALARAIEAARQAAYQDHWEETWPDKLKGAEPGKKLGVANQRFHERRGGGSAAYFKDLERQRLAAGDE